MQRLTEKKIIVVTRETRLVGLKRRFNTARQAKFYVEHLGGDFKDYTTEQEAYQAAIEETEADAADPGRGAGHRPVVFAQFCVRAGGCRGRAGAGRVGGQYLEVHGRAAGGSA